MPQTSTRAEAAGRAAGPAPAGDRLADRDLDRLARLFFERTGIVLDRGKRPMIESRLRRRVSASGLSGFAAYCRLVCGPHGQAEAERLVDCLTTHKTEFFREARHFTFLEETALPTLARAVGGARPLRLWSAAASTGEEAWSIAMVAHAVLEALGEPAFVVFGSDVSSLSIERAARAIYPQEALAPVPEALRRRYVMLPRDRRRQDCKIVPELRAHARFATHNLVEPGPRTGALAEGRFDVIFLRNVLIYFDPPTQARIVQGVLDQLRPGGYLMVGHAENLSRHELGLVQLQPSVYQRAGA